MATDSDAVVRAGLSSVTKGTLFLLVSTLLLVALTFVSRVVIVRSVSPADWSAFSFGLTLAGVLGALGSLGLPTAVARSLPYATTDDERRTIVRGTLWIGSVAALGSSLLLFVFAQPIGQSLGSPRITLGLQYFPIAVGSGIVASLIASIFQGYEDVTPNALFIQIVNPTLFVAFLAFAIVAPPLGISYHEALLAYALASVATLGLLVVYLVLRLPHHLAAGLRSPTALPRFLRFVAPLFVVSVMGTITGSADTLVLGIFHPLEVGTYTASLTLARLLPIGIGAAAYIFLPVASRFLRLNEPRSIGITYVTVTKWMTLISLPLFLLFFFLPSSCLGFVYGPNYTAIVVPLQIVVAGAFATTLLGPASTAQVAFGQTRLLAANAIAAGVADVVVAFALVPTYGYVGAAIAWGVATATSAVLSLVELAVLTGIHPFHGHLVVPVLATGLPIGAALWFFHPNLPFWALPALGLGIALLFVVLVLATRSIDEGDRLLLEAVEQLFGRPLPFFRRLGRYALRRQVR
ncbi:MAG: oligosaccharide flippase family protein [Thermoplasmata archaeon]